MFQKLFNPDNALMITMAQISDCIFLSLFWLLCAFPLLTLGASTAALYDSVVRAYRRGDKHAWGRFIKVFRENLRGGLLPTVVFLAVFAAGGWGLIQLWNAAVAGILSWMIFSAGAFLAMLVLGVLSVMFPMLSRFENSFDSLLRNTLLLAMANLPRTVALGFLNICTIFLCARYIFPLFFLPALSALLGSLFLEPMFRPYMTAGITSPSPEEEEEIN